MLAPELDAERFAALEEDPRLLTRPATDSFAIRNGVAISAAAFLGDVATCADALPDAPAVINLCSDRYRFTVAFYAAALRSKTTLLPSQRSSESIDALRTNYPECQVIADDPDTASDYLVDFAPGQNGTESDLIIEPAQTAAIAFTSGSTGTPKAHAKTWAMLVSGRATHARYLARALKHNDQLAHNINQLSGLVATVPSWHMYGLEWAMLLPTIAPLQLFCGPDFFPGDVTSALDSFGPASTNLLVSTPLHLRALAKSVPPTSGVTSTVCATAPIDPGTVRQTENHLGTRIFEIYGCSEIGSLACRQPGTDAGWEFFDNLDLSLHNGELTISTPLLKTPVTLADRFNEVPGQHTRATDQRFELLGRATDLVKVAGRRESLANLNSLLLSLPGVDDGVIYQPQSLGVPGGERLAAFVVGSSLDVQALRSALLERLDPVFVPRPIRVINALPRDTTSKLKVEQLKLLAQSFADD